MKAEALWPTIAGIQETDLLDGLVWDNAPSHHDFDITDLRETAGIGLRVRTPWFLIRGDYGFVLDQRPGERRSRFYFSIGQAF